MCVHVYVCKMYSCGYVHIYVCVVVRGQHQVSFLHHSSHCFFEAGSLLHLNLIDLARLIGQRVLGIHLSIQQTPQHLLQRRATVPSFFIWVLEFQAKVLIFVRQALYH